MIFPATIDQEPSPGPAMLAFAAITSARGETWELGQRILARKLRAGLIGTAQGNGRSCHQF